MTTRFDSKAYLGQLTARPGVYRMYGAAGDLLYVGKARNLRKRVGSYFFRASGNPRIEAMVAQIHRVEVTVTNSEDEALLLEAALIKEQQPRYNILYRDDKSYPYVRFAAHAFPRIAFYRGARQAKERYFGPFPSATAVRETLQSLQKLFRLRPCRDSFFANRTRPCLQHQIGRCSAPCVGLIAQEDYARDVHNAQRLLEGRADELAGELHQDMARAAAALEFERAARLRDQIAALQRVRETRAIRGRTRDLDVVAVAPHAASSCVVVMSVRDGLNLGHRSHFPRHPPEAEPDALLESFISQHYLESPVPREILVSHPLGERPMLEAALGRHAGHRVRIVHALRGARRQLMDSAAGTALQSLSAYLAQSASMDQRLLELQQRLGLERTPARIECFDISHTRGESAVASCVVFNEAGPLKSAYRKFNISGITPGDDYAGIRQAVLRRYARVAQGDAVAPDLLLIDGGRGQLAAALDGLDEAGIQELRVVAVAKGAGRRPGLEELHLPETEAPLRLPADSPALHLIQRIRDEAHRFAITGHRGRREKARLGSGLDAVEGLGPVRRRALLSVFGGLAQIKGASVDDLGRVQGISRRLAERIYAHFH
jgi:excinuclease ABC subunit C